MRLRSTNSADAIVAIQIIAVAATMAAPSALAGKVAVSNSAQPFTKPDDSPRSVAPVGTMFGVVSPKTETVVTTRYAQNDRNSDPLQVVCRQRQATLTTVAPMAAAISGARNELPAKTRWNPAPATAPKTATRHSSTASSRFFIDGSAGSISPRSRRYSAR